MKTIKIYRASTQNSDGGAAKGTSSNPYTKEEFESMLEAGTWKGGCVEGMGYVIPRVDIMGSSNSFYDSDTDSWSDPWGSISDPWGSSEENTSSQPSGGGGGTYNNSNTPSGSGHIKNSGTGENNGNINTSIKDVLPISAFRGYISSDPAGCLNRCREMLAIANCQLNNKEIAMVAYDCKGRATEATDIFQKGFNYIDEQLRQNKPVIVAVDYKESTSMGKTRLDQAGDHFVIIVGGSQTIGYHYYDPATKYQERGTNSANIFYLEGNLMKNNNTCTGVTHHYILTSIRENK